MPAQRMRLHFMNFPFAHAFHFFPSRAAHRENEKFMEKLIKQKICVYYVLRKGIYYILLEFN